MAELERVDVLAVGAHPDDVEIAVGGTLAKLVRAGVRVGALHLTRGEAGTRGSAELREQEAREAATVLGLHAVRFLSLGDGGLRCDRESEDAIIAELRALRPRIVLIPPEKDRHPDHTRAHRLVGDAIFYAGLAKRTPEAGVAHRPSLVLSYMLHHPFEPQIVVDVSNDWQSKLEALGCYRSQLWSPEAADESNGTETKVSSQAFFRSIEGRARHYGQQIGVELGEPLLSPLPLPVDDLSTFLSKGLP